VGFFRDEWYRAVRKWEFLVHETKKKVLFRFLGVFLVVLTYFLYVAHRFGGGKGLSLTLLTWSFFVFCTPVADAGILIDFPVRLLTKVRMVYAEAVVWFIAALINAYTLFFHPSLYETTLLLTLLHHIFVTPWPFGLIMLLSALGTFFSIIFADELIDVAEDRHRKLHKAHRRKLKLIIMVALIVFILLLYDFLLQRMAVALPLF